MKLNLKLKTLIYFFIIFLTGFISISQTYSVTLPDGDDQFRFSSPLNNETLEGLESIAIVAYDDNSKDIQYSANLFDAKTCSTISYGRITNSSYIKSIKNEEQYLVWNSKSTLDVQNIADGSYCLRICAGLDNDGEFYTACDSKTYKIFNNNRPPLITSTPPTNEFLEGEIFTYNVEATDPDGDLLTYRFIKTTNFLTINKDTGVITSQPLTRTGVSGRDKIFYDLEIAVSDGTQSEVKQKFRITIIPTPIKETPISYPAYIPLPIPIPTPLPNPITPIPLPEEPKKPVPILENIFITPKRKATITTPNFIIRWDNSSLDESIKKVKLEYSSDSEKWFLIGNEIDKNVGYYLWEVSKLVDNDYYLKLTDDKNKQYVSDLFTVQIDTKNENNSINSIPVIINVKPANNAKLPKDFQVLISGEFIPSDGHTIKFETFKVLLDEINFLSNCKVDDTSFLCTSSETLPSGKHTVKVEVEDTSSQIASLDWIFEIEGENSNVVVDENKNNPTNNNSVLNTDTTNLIWYGLGALALLIVIPWIIYVIWSGGRNKEEHSENVNNLYNKDYSIPEVDYSSLNSSFNQIPEFDESAFDPNITIPQFEDTNVYKEPTPIEQDQQS